VRVDGAGLRVVSGHVPSLRPVPERRHIQFRPVARTGSGARTAGGRGRGAL